MALLDDIANVIVNAGIAGTGTSWNLYLSYFPDTPDNIVAIFETGGLGPDQTDGTRYDKLSFQVRVRSSAFTYDTARTKIQEVFDELNDKEVSGYVYIFASQSGPLSLGYDDNNRPALSINFEAMKQRA